MINIIRPSVPLVQAIVLCLSFTGHPFASSSICTCDSSEYATIYDLQTESETESCNVLKLRRGFRIRPQKLRQLSQG